MAEIVNEGPRVVFADPFRAAEEDLEDARSALEFARLAMKDRLAAGYDPTRCMGEVPNFGRPHQCPFSAPPMEEFGGILGLCGQHRMPYTARIRAAESALQRLRESATAASSDGEPFEGGVYGILDTERRRVKIGVTGNLPSRLATLRTASSAPLEVVAWIRTVSSAGAYALEAALHRRFDADRVVGEWFNLTPEIEAWLEEVHVTHT